MDTHASLKQLQKKAFSSQNINREIGVYVTLILEIKLQKYVFYQNRIIFLASYGSILIPY